MTHRDVLLAYALRLEDTLGEAARNAATTPPLPAGDAQPAAVPEALHGYRVIDLVLGGDTRLAGRRLRDVPWPPATLVIALRRGHTSEVPNGDTVMHRGDRLAVLVPAEFASDLVDLVSAERDDGAHEDGAV